MPVEKELPVSGHDTIADIHVCEDIWPMQQAKVYPELRSLTGQMGEDLRDLSPISGNFCHTRRAEIGARGREGADTFEFEVCSPEWLEIETDNYPIVSGNPRLITKRFDPATIEDYVRKRLLHACAADWETVANKLGQWSRWEFDSYDR